jgi:hypothetical protein
MKQKQDKTKEEVLQDMLQAAANFYQIQKPLLNDLILDRQELPKFPEINGTLAEYVDYFKDDYYPMLKDIHVYTISSAPNALPNLSLSKPCDVLVNQGEHLTFCIELSLRPLERSRQIPELHSIIQHNYQQDRFERSALTLAKDSIECLEALDIKDHTSHVKEISNLFCYAIVQQEKNGTAQIILKIPTTLYANEVFDFKSAQLAGSAPETSNAILKCASLRFLADSCGKVLKEKYKVVHKEADGYNEDVSNYVQLIPISSTTQAPLDLRDPDSDPNPWEVLKDSLLGITPKKDYSYSTPLEPKLGNIEKLAQKKGMKVSVEDFKLSGMISSTEDYLHEHETSNDTIEEYAKKFLEQGNFSLHKVLKIAPLDNPDNFDKALFKEIQQVANRYIVRNDLEEPIEYLPCSELGYWHETWILA